MIRRTILTLLLLLLAACGGGNTEQEGTLAAQNATLSTEIAYRRQTATIGAEQIRVTNDAFATQIKGATDRQQAIVRTLEALGVFVVGLEQITPVIQPPTARPDEVSNPASNTGGGITLIPPTLEAPEVTPTVIVNDNIPPTLDPTAPNLANISVSSSVGADDCATGAASTFDASTPELYAVGTANNFPAGMSVTFNWLRGAEVVYSDTFTWDFEINGKCVWYFVTPAEFEFLPGEYTVTFESSGAAVGSPVTFTLTDPNAVDTAPTAEITP
jgi:hypothetical protein